MFGLYEPNVKATIAFLRLLKVRVNNATVNETLQNHPDWPSLLCISDSLKKWNVPNGAGQVNHQDKDSIDEIPVPFMIHTSDAQYPLAVVTGVTDQHITYYQKDTNRTTKELRETFLKRWYGVYLIAEPDTHSGEINYKAHKRKALFESLLSVLAFTALLILSLYLLRSNKIPSFASTTGVYLQYLIDVVGVLSTILLLWYEIDKNNSLLQKVCLGATKTNCSAILSSKQAKIFSWLSWSEVGFFYFAGNLLCITIVPSALAILAWLGMVALTYPIFSIYYQWIVAKQWCTLCLTVQALLVLSAANIWANEFFLPQQPLRLLDLGFCLLLLFISPLCWYVIKPFLLALQAAKSTRRDYFRIKFNSEIFETLMRKQKRLGSVPEDLGIDIGNPSATKTIIKVCNPFCGPCSALHPKIETLLEQNKNVRVKIIFATPNDETSIGYEPVSHLMAIAAEKNIEKTKQALNDWYLAREKNYEAFAAKYPVHGELRNQKDKIIAMDNWCKATNIEFTPTLFVNGLQLPNVYSIEDLQYFLLE